MIGQRASVPKATEFPTRHILQCLLGSLVLFKLVHFLFFVIIILLLFSLRNSSLLYTRTVGHFVAPFLCCFTCSEAQWLYHLYCTFCFVFAGRVCYPHQKVYLALFFLFSISTATRVLFLDVLLYLSVGPTHTVPNYNSGLQC